MELNPVPFETLEIPGLLAGPTPADATEAGAVQVDEVHAVLVVDENILRLGVAVPEAGLAEPLQPQLHVRRHAPGALALGRFERVLAEHGHALRYARIARDRSLKTGRRDWLAFSQNLVANILLAESQFDEACSRCRGATR